MTRSPIPELVVPLAGNGGPTATHLLGAASPAIDAADPTVCPEVDQRGVPRPPVGGGICDVGAVEGTTAVTSADLSVALTDSPDPVIIGSAITYTATVTNTGPGAADGVNVSVTLPTGSTFASADPGCVHTSGTVTCAVGSLAAADSAVRTVVASAPAEPGTVIATADVPVGGDPDPSDNGASTTTSVVLPSVSVADAVVVEGTSASPTEATVPVSLSAPAGVPVSVQWNVTPGTATAGDDFTAPGGALTFDPGETSVDIPVSVVADALVEDDESFTIDLSAPDHVTIVDGTATVVIEDDDGPTLSVADVSVIEPDVGSARADVVVRRGSGEGTASVRVTTADGSATQPGDYRSRSVVVRFAAGVTERLVGIAVAGRSPGRAGRDVPGRAVRPGRRVDRRWRGRRHDRRRR